MTNNPNPALPFALKAAILENADRLGLKAGAIPDLVARLIKAGVALTGDRITMPCGRDAISYAVEAIRSGFDDQGGEYLFEAAPTTPPTPKPKATPGAAASDVSTPIAAARARATRIEMVTAKLALANGEDV